MADRVRFIYTMQTIFVCIASLHFYSHIPLRIVIT